LTSLWEHGAGIVPRSDSARLALDGQGSASLLEALIVAAAELRGCRWLLSEDFQAGQKLGSVTVVNPFRALPDEFGLKNPAKR